MAQHTLQGTPRCTTLHIEFHSLWIGRTAVPPEPHSSDTLLCRRYFRSFVQAANILILQVVPKQLGGIRHPKVPVSQHRGAGALRRGAATASHAHALPARRAAGRGNGVCICLQHGDAGINHMYMWSVGVHSLMQHLGVARCRCHG